jgi:hemoglobin/transferrin/lactoferrin receptor protein
MIHSRLAIACCAALLAARALGQTPTSEATLLDTVVVTATSRDAEIFDVPYAAHGVERERFLLQRQARTLVDALGETPGVMIQRTSYGQASPFLRGFTGFRTLTLIDGIRLNNAVFREGPNQYFATIDPLTIDRLDVVLGPSSVLYGSDAIGGTVNAITRGPEMLPWPEPAGGGKGSVAPAPTANTVARGGGYYRYGTADKSHTMRGEFGLAVTPHVGIFGGVTWKDFNDVRGGDTIGRQPNTGYTDVDGDIKVVVRPNRNVDITAAFQRVEQNNVPRTHSTIFAKSFDGTVVGTDLRRDLDQLRELAYLQLEIRELAPWIERAKLSLSWQNQEETQDRIRSDGRRLLTGFQDQTFGVLLNLVSPSPIGTLSYGVEYYHDEVSSFGRSYNADGSLRAIDSRGPVADDASYDLLGIYLQDEFKIVEPLTVIAGVRYSHARAQADKVDPNPTDDVRIGRLDKSFDAFSASLRVRLDVSRSWNFYGGVSQGFRAPNLSDFTSFELARSGELETPAPNLDPEYYTSFEIGTKARIEPWHLSLFAAYYYTLIDDQIVRFPTGRVIDGANEVTKANVGDGYTQGVEVGAEWKFYPGFTLFGNLAWTEGELDTFVGSELQTRPGSRIAPLTGLIGLRWNSADGKWWLEGSAALARHQDRLSPGDTADTQRIPPGGTRGYHVFTVRGGWNPCKHLKLFAACENISNEDYRTLGSGTNEPGTNFVLGGQFTF